MGAPDHRRVRRNAHQLAGAAAASLPPSSWGIAVGGSSTTITGKVEKTSLCPLCGEDLAFEPGDDKLGHFVDHHIGPASYGRGHQLELKCGCTSVHWAPGELRSGAILAHLEQVHYLQI